MLSGYDIGYISDGVKRCCTSGIPGESNAGSTKNNNNTAIAATKLNAASTINTSPPTSLTFPENKKTPVHSLPIPHLPTSSSPETPVHPQTTASASPPQTSSTMDHDNLRFRKFQQDLLASLSSTLLYQFDTLLTHTNLDIGGLKHTANLLRPSTIVQDEPPKDDAALLQPASSPPPTVTSPLPPATSPCIDQQISSYKLVVTDLENKVDEFEKFLQARFANIRKVLTDSNRILASSEFAGNHPSEKQNSTRAKPPSSSSSVINDPPQLYGKTFEEEQDEDDNESLELISPQNETCMKNEEAKYQESFLAAYHSSQEEDDDDDEATQVQKEQSYQFTNEGFFPSSSISSTSSTTAVPSEEEILSKHSHDIEIIGMEGTGPRTAAFSSSSAQKKSPARPTLKEKRDRSSSSTADSTAAESIAADSIQDSIAGSMTTTSLSPLKKLRNNSKLWWTEELQYLKHEVTLARGLVRLFGDEESKQRAKETINHYHRAIRDRKSEFFNELGENGSSSADLKRHKSSGTEMGASDGCSETASRCSSTGGGKISSNASSPYNLSRSSSINSTGVILHHLLQSPLPPGLYMQSVPCSPVQQDSLGSNGDYSLPQQQPYQHNNKHKNQNTNNQSQRSRFNNDKINYKVRNKPHDKGNYKNKKGFRQFSPQHHYAPFPQQTLLPPHPQPQYHLRYNAPYANYAGYSGLVPITCPPPLTSSNPASPTSPGGYYDPHVQAHLQQLQLQIKQNQHQQEVYQNLLSYYSTLQEKIEHDRYEESVTVKKADKEGLAKQGDEEHKEQDQAEPKAAV